MSKVTLVIPNYNGIQFLDPCLNSVAHQTILADLEVLVIDNGSTDGSMDCLEERFPWVRPISLDENYGFCRAVNEGIRAAKSEFIILLNNDTTIEPEFCEELLTAIQKDTKIFSCAAKMIQSSDHSRLDDAGNFYCALGWAFARAKGKSSELYSYNQKIFASCGGAAIYRKSVFEEIGDFDEEHFAYLEDIDIGYRAQIYGYENWYIPKAQVYHVGSGTTGSRYNEFKIGYSARNNVYLIYKNMPLLQLILNMPLLLIGFAVKGLFFAKKNYGKEYWQGLKAGIELCKKNGSQKVRFKPSNFLNYCKIQLQLWVNILRRVKN